VEAAAVDETPLPETPPEVPEATHPAEAASLRRRFAYITLRRTT